MGDGARVLPSLVWGAVMRAAWRNLAIGIASGLAAAWVMDTFQEGWSAVRKSAAEDDPPQQGSEEKSEPTTVKAADRVSNVVAGGPVAEPHRALAGQAVHYSFGAYLGAFYALVLSNFPKASTGFGTLYGAAVWLVADEFLVPAGDLTPPPRDVPASIHVYAFVSHLMFGAALEGSWRAIEAAFQVAARGEAGT